MEFAAISGRLGKAVFQDERGRFALSVDGDFAPYRCRSDEWVDVTAAIEPHDIPALGKLTVDGLADALELATDRHDALRLITRVMEPSWSDHVRHLSLKAAEEWLAEDDIRGFVSDHLLGCPLPQGADPVGGAELARGADAPNTAELLARLDRCAPVIERVWSAWRTTAEDHSLSDDDTLFIQAHLIGRGVFARIVAGLSDEMPGAVSATLMSASTDAVLRAHVPRIAHLMTGLIKKLGTTAPSPRPTAAEEPEQEAGKVIHDDAPASDPIAAKIAAAMSKRGRRAGPTRTSRSNLNKIQDAVRWIGERFAEGRTDRALHALERLVDQQLANSAPGDLAKSLCAIAAAATEAGHGEIALTLYDHAVLLEVNDAVTHNGRAETLRALGRHDEALTAYDQAVAKFPNNPVTQTGRAETLRALGRHDEALTAYDQAVAKFPNNPVTQTGRAETLRALGRHDEALTAYDQAVAKFPNNPVTQTGRAETLRALGRHDEALTAYDQAVAKFPNDPFAQNGRAETLRALGRHDEALTAYDQAVAKFPNDPVTQNGRAETLRALGRHDEALTAYDQAVAKFPNNPVTQTGRAETLRALGRHDEALTAYDQAVAKFPNDPFAQTGRAETLRALGRHDEALTAYDQAVAKFPNNPVTQNGRAETLRALGRHDEALTAYDQAVAKFPNNPVTQNGRAETLRALGRHDEALTAYDQAVAKFPNDPVTQTGRASLLVAMGRYAEARASLPDGEPRTEEDWIAEHIIAMSHLREGDVAEATRRLRTGLAASPFPQTKPYFATALAVAELRLGKAMEAANVLRLDDYFKGARPGPERGLLLCHAEAALGNTGAAITSLNAVAKFTLVPVAKSLRDHLTERYGLENTDTHSVPNEDRRAELDDRIREEEEQLLAA